MALRDNLISWWELNETSGTRVDAHGSNDLTDNNTVGNATGKQGNGADFEASNSETLSIADASQSGLDLTGDLSFSLWFKPESSPAKFGLINKQSSGNESYQFGYRNSGGLRLFFICSSDGGGAGEDYNTQAVDLGTGTFKHLVFTYDASSATGEFFVDGVSIGSFTDTNTSIYNGTAPFAIGGRPSVGDYSDGVVDEVGVWNRVLTGAEITELYNSGDGMSYADTAGGTNVSAGVSSSASSVPTPTVAGGATVSCAVSSSASSTPSPTVTGQALVSGDESTGVISNPSPTILAGGIVVTGAVSSSAGTNPSPTVVVSTSVTADESVGVSSSPSPTLALGILIEPDAVVAVASVPDVDVEADFWNDTYESNDASIWSDKY